MTRTLDRSKPHGNVFGHDKGAVFEQDGCLFDNQGNCVYEPASAPPPAAPEPPADVPSDRRAKLEALHISKLKKLAEDLGITPATGPGSKVKIIDDILAVGG